MHCPEEDCYSSNVLACPSKEWWMVTAVIIADAVVDVASPASSHTAIVVAPELLLEHRA
jgi:hypothetical protein